MVEFRHNHLTRTDLLNGGSPPPHVVSEFLQCALWSGAQLPILGVTQVIDATFDCNLTEKSTLMEAPRQAPAFSVRWHIQQLGAATGVILPMLLVHKCVGRLGDLALGKIPKNAQPQVTIRRSVCESAATGVVFDGLLRPVHLESDGKGDKDFLTARFNNAAISAVTYGVMTRSSIACRNIASERGLLSAILRNDVASSVLSGVPAGLVNAELTARIQSNRGASGSEFLQSIYCFSAIGGGMACGNSLLTKLTHPRVDGPGPNFNSEFAKHHELASKAKRIGINEHQQAAERPEVLQHVGLIKTPNRLLDIVDNIAAEHLVSLHVSREGAWIEPPPDAVLYEARDGHLHYGSNLYGAKRTSQRCNAPGRTGAVLTSWEPVDNLHLLEFANGVKEFQLHAGSPTGAGDIHVEIFRWFPDGSWHTLRPNLSITEFRTVFSRDANGLRAHKFFRDGRSKLTSCIETIPEEPGAAFNALLEMSTNPISQSKFDGLPDRLPANEALSVVLRPVGADLAATLPLYDYLVADGHLSGARPSTVSFVPGQALKLSWAPGIPIEQIRPIVLGDSHRPADIGKFGFELAGWETSK